MLRLHKDKAKEQLLYQCSFTLRSRNKILVISKKLCNLTERLSWLCPVLLSRCAGMWSYNTLHGSQEKPQALWRLKPCGSNSNRRWRNIFLIFGGDPHVTHRGGKKEENEESIQELMHLTIPIPIYHQKYKTNYNADFRDHPVRPSDHSTDDSHELGLHPLKQPRDCSDWNSSCLISFPSKSKFFPIIFLDRYRKKHSFYIYDSSYWMTLLLYCRYQFCYIEYSSSEGAGVCTEAVAVNCQLPFSIWFMNWHSRELWVGLDDNPHLF